MTSSRKSLILLLLLPLLLENSISFAQETSPIGEALTPWWETGWFRATLVLLFLALIAGAMRLRARTITLQKQQLEAEVARQTAIIKENEAQKRHLAVLEERQKIGRELHDDISQVISFVNIQSQALLRWLQQGDLDKVTATANQLVNISQDAHADIREFILGIREQRDGPPSGEFIPSLQKYLQKLEERYQFEIDLQMAENWYENRLFPKSTETQLLRIIQESLNNVRKHAQTNSATIRFTEIDKAVLIAIIDKGVGFSPPDPTTNQPPTQSAEDSAHFGLTIMQERAESIGATLRIQSFEGQGTTILVSVPKIWESEQDSTLEGLRVLLVDDHQIYLEGIANMLRTHGINVVGQAANGREAQQLVANLKPQLVLMDINMPICDGIEATKRIKAEWPETVIVILTVLAEEAKLFDALRFGASGYLLKSTSSIDFFKMLQAAMRGESALTPGLASKMLLSIAQEPAGEPTPERLVTTAITPPEAPSDTSESDDTAKSDAPVLTFRQQQILELVTQGYTNAQIAEELFISTSTVKSHLSRLLRALEVKSRYELRHYKPADSD